MEIVVVVVVVVMVVMTAAHQIPKSKMLKLNIFIFLWASKHIINYNDDLLPKAFLVRERERESCYVDSIRNNEQQTRITHNSIRFLVGTQESSKQCAGVMQAKHFVCLCSSLAHCVRVPNELVHTSSAKRTGSGLALCACVCVCVCPNPFV